MPPLTRRPLAGATMALVAANARYWSTVAPGVRRELQRWRRRAHTIDEPRLRAMALSKLDGEGFNAEAGAMLATLAPREQRDDVLVAVVALQLLFDLLDGLTERPSSDPLTDGERMFEVFTGALAHSSEPPAQASAEDERYLHELADAARSSLARLPAFDTVAPAALAAAARASQAQVRMHAAAHTGTAALQRWAESQAQGRGLGWQEMLAGCGSSVLAVHALIVAGADARTTDEQASQIDTAYLSTCVLVTLMDALVDHREDVRRGELGYLGLYQDPRVLRHSLPLLARRAAEEASALPDGAHHLMILTGVVAFYASAPGAEGPLARPVIDGVRRELAPLLAPTVGVMRLWRYAKARSSHVNGAGRDA